MEEHICEVCGRNYSEQHHFVHRSQAKYMENVDINKIRLCNEHHRGNQWPHLNNKVDVEYKLQLQRKLFKLFAKPYYRLSEIKEVLGMSESEVQRFVKVLRLYKERFDRLDIVIRCMGGKLYGQ